MATDRHFMDSSNHAVRWDKDIATPPATSASKARDPDAPIRVLNDAFRSASTQKLRLVSGIDDKVSPPGSQRYVSCSAMGDKSHDRQRALGTYQGSAMASLSSMLADGAYAEANGDPDSERSPHTQYGYEARPGSKSSAGTAGYASSDSPHSITSLLGPPDPSLYSPLGPDVIAGHGANMRPAYAGCTDYVACEEAARREDKEGPITLSKLLDKFAAEEEAGPIIRSKNYVKQASSIQGSQGQRSSSNQRSASSLAHLQESYGGGRTNASSRPGSRCDNADDADYGAEDDAGDGLSLRHRSSMGLSSMHGVPDPLQAASEATLSSSAVSRPPRPARPGGMPSPPPAEQPPLCGGFAGSRGSSPIPSRPRPRPVDQGLTSSTSDIHALQDAASRPSVVFSSVSALPPLAGGQGQGTPPRPRQPPRPAGALAPTPPPQPSPPQGERVLSRHASPARGAMGSRDASPARPIPRAMGSRDASPSGPRPMAATEIVAAAVAEIAAASRDQQRQQHGGGGSAGGGGVGSPGGQAPRPPRPQGQAAGGAAPTAPRGGPPPATWDVALRDASPSRMPSGHPAPPAAEDSSSLQQQQRDQPAPPPRPRASGPMLRSRDSSPLRASLGSGTGGEGLDPEMAEIMWRLPMRMGVTPQVTARTSGGGRKSRDASPDTRGSHGVADGPPQGAIPAATAAATGASAGAPPRHSKPLTKPPQWGRGGGDLRGVSPPTAGEGSGLGNTLPTLVQAHVFLNDGQFDVVHGRR